MNISNTQRILKLTANLCANPDLLLPYFKHNIFTKKYPIEWDLPWWSYLAIYELDKLAPGKTIFEFGTGGSTVRYGKVAKNITSVEDDTEWLSILRGYLSDEVSKKLTLLNAPFDFDSPKGFGTSDYLQSLNSNYDIIIIDGQDKTFRERVTCFYHAQNFINPNGIIVVDDFWRYTKILDHHSAKDFHLYESVGPCRYGVTSTAFFHY